MRGGGKARSCQELFLSRLSQPLGRPRPSCSLLACTGKLMVFKEKWPLKTPGLHSRAFHAGWFGSRHTGQRGTRPGVPPTVLALSHRTGPWLRPLRVASATAPLPLGPVPHQSRCRPSSVPTPSTSPLDTQTHQTGKQVSSGRRKAPYPKCPPPSPELRSQVVGSRTGPLFPEYPTSDLSACLATSPLSPCPPRAPSSEPPSSVPSPAPRPSISFVHRNPSKSVPGPQNLQRLLTR